MTPLYFAWLEGVGVIPERPALRRRRFLERILFENILYLFIILIATSIFLNKIIGQIAV